MRKLSSFVTAILSAMIIFGCGGGKQSMQSASAGDIPEWFLTKPEDPNSLFETATSTSEDMQMAIDKSVEAARVAIGRQMEVKITGLQKRFQEETGLGNDAQLLDQFTQVSKSVVSATLTGSKEKQKKVLQDGSVWRAYVLVEYPLGAAQEALRAQIKKNEQLYTRLRASDAFKELDEAADKYEHEQGKK